MFITENFLRLLSIALESGDKKEITLAASAVWALLHNCSKAINNQHTYTYHSNSTGLHDVLLSFQIKNSLKKSELAEKLGNIHFSMKPDQPTTTGTHSRHQESTHKVHLGLYIWSLITLAN